MCGWMHIWGEIMAVDFVIKADHSAEFKADLERKIEAALEACGIQAVSHTVNNITKDAYKHPVDWYTRTAHLKDFSHKVVKDEKAVYIGTNVQYAKYWEYGTGHYSDKGGRQGFWVFVPGNSSSGSIGSSKVYTEAEAKRIMAILQSKGIDAHMTDGIKPDHRLKNATEQHKDEYTNIMRHYTGDV